MIGKDKCKALKEIRKQIAEKNDIPYITSQCNYQGDCKGTCPKCEAELKYLEKELKIRQSLGKAVAIVGISTSMSLGLASCGPDTVVDELSGDVAIIENEVDTEENSTETAENDIETTETDIDTTKCEIETIDEEEYVELEGDIAPPEGYNSEYENTQEGPYINNDEPFVTAGVLAPDDDYFGEYEE